VASILSDSLVIESGAKTVCSLMEEVHPSVGTLVRFGVFELDLRAAELRKQGFKIKLQEQPFQILQILLENPGQVVTREAIQKRIWPSDTFVDFDHGLYNAIKRLREALGDDPETPRYIETIPKRGYRFIGAPNGHAGARTEPQTLENRLQQGVAGSRQGKFLLAAATVLVIAATVFALNSGGIRERILSGLHPPAIHSLAVIPLQNLSGDPNQEYFADGMSDALITELSQIKALKVISRTSTIRYKRTDKALPEISRDLGVDGIVEGTVQRSGDRVRVTVQLIYAPSDEHLWAQSYDRNIADALSLEQNLAVAISGQIRARLTPQEEQRLGEAHPVKPAALDAYLQGEHLATTVSAGSGFQDLEKAIGYYEQAIAEDPDFARAYAGLADAYSLDYLSAKEWTPTEKSLLGKALELDPELARAHQLLGTIRLTHDWDWRGAETELTRALELDPNSSFTRNRYALYLAVMGHMDEAKNQLQLAAELNPTSLDGGGYGTGLLPLFRQDDQLIAEDRRALEMFPSSGYIHWELYRLYAHKGMQPETVDELEKTLRSFGFAEVATAVEHAYERSGFTGAMHESIGNLKLLYERKVLFEQCEIARQYVILGEKQKALEWLWVAFKDRNVDLLLKRDPAWDSLRSESSFQKLVRQVGLPE
jgi:TolB-like protein/DNA-binding winged helix-turn-helix (wHTH) protein